MFHFNQELRGGTPALDLIGDNGRKTPSLVKAVDQNRVDITKIAWRLDLMMHLCRVGDTLNLALQHKSTGPTFYVWIAMRIDDERYLAVPPCLILRTLYDLAGKWRRGRAIADEPYQVGVPLGQTPSHRVLSAPQVFGDLPDLPHGGLGNPDVLVVIDCPGRRGNRNHHFPCDILQCDHDA